MIFVVASGPRFVLGLFQLAFKNQIKKYSKTKNKIC